MGDTTSRVTPIRRIAARLRRNPDPVRSGERGQIIVLFALAFVVLLAVASLVIDVGLLRTDGQRLQNALDAAALASARSLPATSSNVASVNATALRYVNQNFSGNWSLQPVSYRCLIGIDSSSGSPKPRMTDMPSACYVSYGQSNAVWQCTGLVCWAPCDPVHVATDVCNTVVVAGSTTRAYSFGRVVGVASGTDGGNNSGSDGGTPGNRLAVACTGLCGSPPTAPLDVVVIVDRTGSMTAAMQQLRDGANSVLQAYNPDIQRIALGTLGPSSLYRTCGTPATTVPAMVIATPGVAYLGTSSGSNLANTTTFQSTVTASTAGASSLTVTKPTGTASGDFLVAAISVSGGSGTTITAPSGWTLINRTDNSTNVSVASYYHAAGAAEGTTYRWTFGASVRASGEVSRYTGVDTTTPIDAAGADSTNSFNSTAAAATGVTTTAVHDRVVGVFAMNASTTFTAPAAMTERSDLGVTSGPTLEVADYDAAAIGATGTQTATAIASGRWAAHTFALRALVTGGSGLVIAKPSGGSVGDVFIAGVSVSGGSATSITAPSGWTLIRRTDNVNTVSVASYYRVVTGTEGASFSWTIGSSAKAAGTISLYTNADTSNLLDPTASSGSGGTGNTGTSTAVAATGVTTTTTYARIVGLFGTAVSTAFTVPTGMTERADVPFSGSLGPTLESADVQQTSAGSTGGKTATAGASGAWAAQLIALRAIPVDIYGIDPADPSTLQSWIPVGFSGLDTGTPAVTASGARGYSEAYSAGGVVVSSSHLGQAIACFDTSGTGTNLATPLAMADYYLQHYGRTGARKGIILETDGSPASCPASLGATICNLYTNTAAQSAADQVKADGITLFTIGYGGSGGVDATLLGNMASTKVGTSTCTDAENTDGDAFFCTPTASELASIFQAAAAALAAGPHLVQLYATPVVSSVAPSGGTRAGGVSVTVSGAHFSDAFSVTFGGVPARFTIVNDTTITVVTPPNASPISVDVQVTTPGGSSQIVASDKYNYN